MPVHRQKKHTTPNSLNSTPEQTASVLPDQRVFHQHLRELARGAVRVVLEGVMREELDALIGVGWGERPRRKGSRNGSYTRDLVTTTGRIEDLQVPRDREGQFHPQVFERYWSSEPQVAQGLTEMLVAGTSTRHPWEKWPKPCWEELEVASASSRLNQSLTQHYETWRQRTLQDHWRIASLDGVHFSIRHGDQCDSTIILTALGVDLAGNKEVWRYAPVLRRTKMAGLGGSHALRERAATHIDLFVTAGHEGKLSAVSEQFTATPRQRCLVHKQRNVLNAIPRRERGEVQAELVGIWEQPTKEEALTQLAASTRQVCSALSSSGASLGGRRRAPLHVLCLSCSHAPTYSDHPCHGKPRKSMSGNELLRSTCLPRRRVV